MARPCMICTHPKLLEINDELIRKVPMKIIEKRYNIPSYSALQRHNSNHLQDLVQEAWNKRLNDLKERGSKIVEGTLDIYNMILSKWRKNDPNSELFSGRDILTVIKERSKLLGEEEGPTRVEIRWGAGLENGDSEKIEYMEIKIPNLKKEEEEKDKIEEEVVE